MTRPHYVQDFIIHMLTYTSIKLKSYRILSLLGTTIALFFKEIYQILIVLLEHAFH